MTGAEATVVRRQVVVNAPQAKAFAAFVPESPDRTRAELEHRHLDRHGPGWQSVAEGVGGDQGWPLYLARYAALFSREG